METLDIKVLKDVLFYVDLEVRLTADVYLPNTTTNRPAILLIHGGAWQTGSMESLHQWGSFLAKAGYVAVSISYRLTTPEKSTWPSVLNDVQAAYDFIVSRAEDWLIDRERIGLIGASAGAHLATLFALTAPTDINIKAVVGVYGVYDLKKWWEYTQQARHDNPVGKLMGSTPEQAPEAYYSASPLFQIGEKKRFGLFYYMGRR